MTGALASTSGSGNEYVADAVVLASGGFAANQDLVGRHIIGGPGTMLVRAHPRSTGEGFPQHLTWARSRAPASTSSTAATCQCPPQSFPPNDLWKSPSLPATPLP